MQVATLYAALSAFILKFCLPQLEQRQVIAAQQNNNSLPAGTNEFVIITTLFDTPRGGVLKSLHLPGEDEACQRLRQMSLLDVQLDFYGPHAARRAKTVSILAGSEEANNFLEGYGVSMTNASPVRNFSNVNTSRQYTGRHSITVYLCAWAAVELKAEYFNQLEATNEVLKDVYSS